MTTNTKAIITKNQKHLLDRVWYQMSGEGVRSKAEAFVKWIELYKDRDHPTAYSVINMRVSGGECLIYIDEIRKYLHSLGLKDDKKLDNFDYQYYDYGWQTMSGPTGLYMALLARDGDRLYRSLKAGKNPLAPKKKKVIRRK